MPLELTTRSVAGSSVIGCSGRIVLGDESAKLRHVVKEALAECNQIVLELGGVWGYLSRTTEPPAAH